MFVHDAARSGGGAVWQWLVSLLKVSGVIVGVGVALLLIKIKDGRSINR